jgi:hypothetical protein
MSRVNNVKGQSPGQIVNDDDMLGIGRVGIEVVSRDTLYINGQITRC